YTCVSGSEVCASQLTRVHTHTHTSCKHTHTHTHTHTQTYTRKHTHTNIHTQTNDMYLLSALLKAVLCYGGVGGRDLLHSLGPLHFPGSHGSRHAQSGILSPVTPALRPAL